MAGVGRFADSDIGHHASSHCPKGRYVNRANAIWNSRAAPVGSDFHQDATLTRVPDEGGVASPGPAHASVCLALLMEATDLRNSRLR